MSDKYTHLLWVDLETTGTDENLDGIVEIACILTPLDLSEQLFNYQAVTWPGTDAINRLLANEYVLNMHKDSGLYAEIGDNGLDAANAAVTVVDLMRVHEVESHKVLIAGSGVAHFDRRFIKAHMRELDGYLAYPALDVGVLRRAAEMWGLDLHDYPEPERKTHRAMDDICLHLDEGRWFRDRFQTWGRGRIWP